MTQFPRNQTGESLIEVLVSLLVFSVGLAGLATLQVNSLKRNLETTQISQASRTVDELTAEIRLNTGGFDGGMLHSSQTGQLYQCSVGSDCNPRQRAESSFRDAVGTASHLLTSIQLVVCRDATPDDGSASDPACDGGDQLTTKLWWVLDIDPDKPVRRMTRTVPIP